MLIIWSVVSHSECPCSQLILTTGLSDLRAHEYSIQILPLGMVSSCMSLRSVFFIVMPASSYISRATASAANSLGSTIPPGKSRCLAKCGWLSLRNNTSTLPSVSMISALAIFLIIVF